MQLENLALRNVFRTAKQENKTKQHWKKRRIDGAGDHFWIVNSRFERNPRTNRDLVLTAMGAGTLKLKGISQSQSHFRYEKDIHCAKVITVKLRVLKFVFPYLIIL